MILHPVQGGQHRAEFQVGLLQLPLRRGRRHDPGPGEGQGAAAFDQAGTEGGVELAVPGQVAVTDRPGVPAPVEALMTVDPIHGQVSRQARHGRGGVQGAHHIQDVRPDGGDGADRRGQMLDAGQPQYLGRGRGIEHEASVIQPTAHLVVYVAVFLQLLRIVPEALG